MRRALLALVLTGCLGTGAPPLSLTQYDVLVRSDYPERVVLYWSIGQTRMGVMAVVSSGGSVRLQVPYALRDIDRLRVMVCRGRWSRTTDCSYADGLVRYGPHGTIIRVFASPRLYAMVTG